MFQRRFSGWCQGKQTWERWGDVQGRKGLCLKQSQVKQVLLPTMSKAHTLLMPPRPGHKAWWAWAMWAFRLLSALVSLGMRCHSIAAGPSNPRQRLWLRHLGEGNHGHASCRVSQGKFPPWAIPCDIPADALHPGKTRQRALRWIALTLPHSSFFPCLKETNLGFKAFEITSKDEISRRA